jgi:glyoxylase-like metal-dependent hydrolase (beta-lactamase superfamily II)
MVKSIAEIVQIPVASTDNFSYLVLCRQTGKAVAVDPGVNPESLLTVVREKEIVLEILANTHGHRDHTMGNQLVQAETGARSAGHPADLPQADILLADGMTLHVGTLEISVLHTPGHTPGSVVFSSADAIITGDTLFVTRCGRADLPGGNPADLYMSLRRLASLPAETRVFPGHDYGPQPTSTIAFELANNPYLQCPDLESFVKLRMG